MPDPLVVPALADLKTYVNTEVGISDYVDITAERIRAFADLSEDWQWIHVDLERAHRDSPYRAPVAHGFLTLSFLSRFLNSTVNVASARLIVSVGLTSVKFLVPVQAGSRIRGKVRMRACSDAESHTEVTWRVTIECEGQRLPACIADWVVRYVA